MKKKLSFQKEIKTKEKNLNDLISSDGRIKRDNIIEAEEISYNNIFKNLTYDQYGFVNKDKDAKNKKKL
jgi:hypothetical protein